MKSLKFFKPALATSRKIDSWRLVLLLATAVSLIGYPNPASAATVYVVGSSYDDGAADGTTGLAGKGRARGEAALNPDGLSTTFHFQYGTTTNTIPVDGGPG